MVQGGSSRLEKSLQTIYRTIDVITVALLLSGQINISGVFFFKGGGFSLSFTGPILGGVRSLAAVETPGADVGLDFISLVAAFLLILDQVNVTGTLITQGGFTIVVSGPIFGEDKRVAYAPEAFQFISIYKDHLFKTVYQ